MQQGREYLLRRDPKSAVEVLESQLVRINGNPTYLALLREAYHAYIAELHLHKQEAEADKYAHLLFILEHGAGKAKVPAVIMAAAPPPPAEAAPKPTVRAVSDDDPFQDKRKTARDLLVEADQEFSNSRFREAGQHYQQAYQEDRAASKASWPRWAYCKLDFVVDQLNKQSTAYADLDSEVQAALQLAPKLEFGKYLLAEINKRRAAQAATGAKAGDVEVTVRDLGRNADGWQVVETANFRIFHNQPRDLVEQAAKVAEHTRADMLRKWFGATAEPWTSKCELYLHHNGDDYSRATGVPATSPGHSSFQLEGGRVVGRRIDLHCDDINLLVAVLPHETTHTVLAGNFGNSQCHAGPMKAWPS